MKLRLFIFIFCSWSASLLQAQDSTTTIRVLDSDYLVAEEGRSWIINGTFEHEDATMECDSTFFNQEQNTLEAYGDVFIRQDDTITVQADRLFYDGNTRVARFFNNITLSDGQAVLTTHFLTYDLNTREGTYHDGGRIVNQDDTLVSRRGYYFVGSKDAYFRENAVVNTPDAVIKSDTLRYNTGTKVAYFYGPTTIQGEDDLIYAENGTYNTDTDQAQFQENAYYQSGNQLLKGNELYYDRQRNFGRASGNVFIIDTVENIILRGELGEYNKATETAFVTDSARVIMITEQDSSRTDTIYLAADTLKTRQLPVPVIQEWISASHDRDVLGKEVTLPQELRETPGIPSETGADSLLTDYPVEDRVPLVLPSDTAQMLQADSLPPPGEVLAQAPEVPDDFIGPPPLRPSDYLPGPLADSVSRAMAAAAAEKAISADSAELPVDSARVIFAYNRVRVFKSDLQAIADSLVYTSVDSVMRCYKTPVVWSEDSQMSAEFMTIAMRNKKIDRLNMYRSAMILSQAETDSTAYNQMSGKEMTGYFTDGAMERLVVEGNARTIYYVPEDSVGTLGINYAENSRTILYFKENKLEVVELVKDADQTTYPPGDPDAVTHLEGFHWRESERPKDKDDIFRVVEPSEPPVVEQRSKSLQAGSPSVLSPGVTP